MKRFIKYKSNLQQSNEKIKLDFNSIILALISSITTIIVAFIAR